MRVVKGIKRAIQDVEAVGHYLQLAIERDDDRSKSTHKRVMACVKISKTLKKLQQIAQKFGL